MDWMRRQDAKEEPQEASNALTPEDDDECYFEEDTLIDEGMVRVSFTARFYTIVKLFGGFDPNILRYFPSLDC